MVYSLVILGVERSILLLFTTAIKLSLIES
nr:MAG TPA: hypothetical protein [Caudoviricetes sp.]